jgi:hypothetical protein
MESGRAERLVAGGIPKLPGLDQCQFSKIEMARKSTPKIDQGAVIAIPLGDGRWALSQVYRPGISFFLLVFEEAIDDLDNLPPLTGRPIIGSWTNDAEVYHGNWKLLTHSPVACGIFVEPEYTVLREGKPWVHSFDGTQWRPKAERGDEGLRNQSSQSPLLLQDSIRAFFGLQAWLPIYDKILLRSRD